MMKKNNFGVVTGTRALAAGVAAMMIATVPAMAQVPGAQTGTASPGRVEEQIKAPRFERALQAPVDVRESKISGAPEGAEKITFELRDIEIAGASAYGEDELRALYADRLGQTITLADLYTIAGDMTRKYRNDGYILTQIVVPPQTIRSACVGISFRWQPRISPRSEIRSCEL